MKTLRISVVILICLLGINGCLHQKDLEQADNSEQKQLISPEQMRMLESFELHNEFIAGCVSEEIADLSESLCEDNQRYCEGDPGSQFDYDQWLTIYESCVAH